MNILINVIVYILFTIIIIARTQKPEEKQTETIEVDSLKSHITNSFKKIEDLKKEVSDYESKIEKLEDDIRRNEIGHKSISNRKDIEFRELRSEYDAALLLVSQYKSEIGNHDFIVRKLEKANIEAQDNISDLQDINQDLRKKCSDIDVIINQKIKEYKINILSCIKEEFQTRKGNLSKKIISEILDEFL